MWPKIKFLGYEASLKKWGELKTRSLQSFDAALKKASEEILDRARYYCPVSKEGSGGNPPGYLRDTSYVIQDSQGVYSIVFSAPYAVYVHENENVPHYPSPKGALFLSRAVQELAPDLTRRIGEHFMATFGPFNAEGTFA